MSNVNIYKFMLRIQNECRYMIGPNKKNSVFWVIGLKSLGRIGIHIFFFIYFFSLEKSIILCILKGISPFKMHRIFFPENLKKSRFHQ